MVSQLRYNKLKLRSLVSAMNENDNLETLENSSEDSETDLEADFEKHDDGIGFSSPPRFSKQQAAEICEPSQLESQCHRNLNK